MGGEKKKKKNSYNGYMKPSYINSQSVPALKALAVSECLRKFLAVEVTEITTLVVIDQRYHAGKLGQVGQVPGARSMEHSSQASTEGQHSASSLLHSPPTKWGTFPAINCKPRAGSRLPASQVLGRQLCHPKAATSSELSISIYKSTRPEHREWSKALPKAKNQWWAGRLLQK